MDGLRGVVWMLVVVVASQYAMPPRAVGQESLDSGTAIEVVSLKDRTPDGSFRSPSSSPLDPLSKGAAIVAGTSAPTCEDISRFQQSPQAVTNRFRGNMYRMDHPATLESFAMELNFVSAVPVPLYFTILSRVIGAEDPRFTRYPDPDSPDTVVQTQGVGRQFYGTGHEMEPLVLEAGRDYLIGVAWGTTAISNSRDTNQAVTYPKPFPTGSAEPRGTVEGAFSHLLNPANGEPPVVVGEGFEVGVDRFSANVMQLCFTAEVGACCCAGSSNCDELYKDECAAAGGFFRGERVACDATACECGACCLPCDGECRSDYERFACLAAAEGATFQGVGSACDDAGLTCPVLSGSCCTEAGCSEVCHASCDRAFGTFGGIGSTCYPVNPCLEACCESAPASPNVLTGFCEDLTPAACLDLAGTPQGVTTTCASLEPEDECGGACCRPNGACAVVGNRLRCEQQFGGDYLGDATTCITSPPTNVCAMPRTVVACCIAQGNCIVTTPEFCDAEWIGGVYQAGVTSCDEVDCFQLPAVACCLGDGSCRADLNKPNCVAANGTPLGGSASCVPNLCSQPRGACCDEGSCFSNQTESQCAARDGTFRGERSTCTSPCPAAEGACCFDADESCEQRTQSACMVPGRYLGNGASCQSCFATGACCFSNGGCSPDRTRTACENLGGTYFGDDTDCTPNECPQPMGACCNPANGACTVRTQPACTAAEGNYMGDGSVCSPGLCPVPTGACCFVDGRPCMALTESGCRDAGGNYQGNDGDCSPDPCPPPLLRACCFDDGSCTVRSQFACESAQGTWHPNDATCSVDLCPQPGACCYSDGRPCTVSLSDACVGGGGVFQGMGSACAPGLCPGACCFPTGPCQIMTASACLAAEGEYQGDGTACVPKPCARACCLPCGECQVLEEAECIAEDGEFLANAPTCNEANCPAEVRGACCRNGACSLECEANCHSAGGVYQGDLTVCSSVHCISVTASNPVNGIIDARQPSEPDGTLPAGFHTVELTFDGPTAGLTAANFTVETTPPGSAPTVMDVQTNGNDATVQLNAAIPTGAWSRIRYVPTDSGVCLGFLPADVDGNRMSNPADIEHLVECLSGTAVCAEHRQDLDRSGGFTPTDLMRGLDLLNKAKDAYTSLASDLPPSPCP